MPDLLAKGTAVTVGVLLALVIGVLVVTSNPPAGAREVKAEFEDAFPLLEGMHVRVDGAIAGSVGEIEVNDRGNADVTLVLSDSVEEPMGDATAAVRQQDTTGDSYVAFDPGGDPDDPRSAEPLDEEEGIACTDHERCPSTLVAPRLDDLLNAFGPAERAGVQLLLVETSKALDGRGDSLNEAALELKPAFEAANQALAEVNEQNEALKSLVTSAEAVTGQAAGRSAELERLIDSLATTVEVTADESEALDAGLERLPETTLRARTTLAALQNAATAGTPLANEVAAGAPGLATALDALPPFLDDAAATLEGTRPTLELTRKLLRAALPSLEIGEDRIVTGAFDLTGATADLLNAVLGGEDAFPALFGDDSYGEGGGTLDRSGFGAVAVEPGNQPSYPAEHEPRNFLRVSAIINCEVFGRPVEPGCLDDVLGLPRGAGAQASGAERSGPGQPEPNGPVDDLGPDLPELDLPKLDLPELDLPDVSIPKLDLPKPGDLDLGLGGRDRDGGKGKRPDERAISDLLDFLMN